MLIVLGRWLFTDVLVGVPEASDGLLFLMPFDEVTLSLSLTPLEGQIFPTILSMDIPFLCLLFEEPDPFDLIDPDWFSLSATASLSVSALSHIIIDASFEDSKKRSIFDIPETRDELFRLVLGAESVRRSLVEGKVSLVLF